MFKETMIIIISIILIVVGNNISVNYAKETIKNISIELVELKNIIEKDEEKTEKSEMKIEDIHNYWKEKYSKLAFFIEHDELEKVDTSITIIKSNIKVNEKEEVIIEIDKVIYILKHIENKTTLRLENIF